MRVLELERYSKVWDSNTNPCIVQGIYCSSLFFVVQSVDNSVHMCVVMQDCVRYSLVCIYYTYIHVCLHSFLWSVKLWRGQGSNGCRCPHS